MKDFGICELSVVPIRKHPNSSSEMVTQLLYGEIFRIIEFNEKWSKISNEFDNYQGWINNIQVNFIEKVNYNTLKLNDPVYSLDKQGYIINSDNEKVSIPIGSLISSCKFLKCKYVGKKTESKDCDIVETAKLYLNSPYTWGGRTLYGIDCSGFSQLVYKILGIKINRDAIQQASQGKIALRKNIVPGDLAFFGDSIEEITHVGIMINKNEIIHAHGKIRIDKINIDGIINSETNKLTHKLIYYRNY